MTVFSLLAALIRRSPFSWAFHAIGLAVAIAVLGSVLMLQRAADARMARDLAGVDLVVGAKGSPLQLVTSTLFQVDAPTGNIPLTTLDGLVRDPLVAAAVPVSLGDSVGGARIVGTTPAYADLYGVTLAQGRAWRMPMEAVLGAGTARRLSLDIGDTFAGEHGLSGGEAHAGRPYRVVGILKPSGAVIDRLVLTDLASVWELHGEHSAEEGAAGDHAHEHETATAAPDRQITAVLVRYRSPLAAVVLPRRIASSPDLQPASPPEEARRLSALVGAGSDAIAGLGLALLALSMIGFLIALAAAVGARRRELALLRALGAPPVRMLTLSLLEGAVLGLAGGLLGAVAARLIAMTVAQAGPGGFALPLPPVGPVEALMVALALGLGLVGAILPGVLAARTDVVRTLRSV
jgi:putative ABC transport system permease protein